MTNRFDSFVKKVPLQQPSLPLTHMTNCYTLRKVIDGDKHTLENTSCEFFKGESLLYLFYGRPAYRIKSDKDSSSLPVEMPVCFVLKYNCIGVPKRIYPFDSGGFQERMYESFIPETLKLDDFLLDPDLDVPPRVVAAFFGSNEGYYLGRAKPLVDYELLDFEVGCYCELIKAKGRTIFDDRCHTIEIQSGFPVSISKDTLLAVVLPDLLLRDPKVVNVVRDIWNAKILHYYVEHHGIGEYMSVIKRLVMDFLKEEKYL